MLNRVASRNAMGIQFEHFTIPTIRPVCIANSIATFRIMAIQNFTQSKFMEIMKNIHFDLTDSSIYLLSMKIRNLKITTNKIRSKDNHTSVMVNIILIIKIIQLFMLSEFAT